MSISEFEFTDNIMYLKGVGPRRAASLKKINIFTMYDFLTHYPRAYEDRQKITPIANLEIDESAVIVGRLSNLTCRHAGKFPIVSGILSDKTGHIPITWFNQEYIMDKLESGMILAIVGKVKLDSWSGQPVMNQINSFSILDYGEKPMLGILPIYASTGKLNQNFFRAAMINLLNRMPELPEILPAVVLRELNLMPLDDAMRAIHFPKSQEELHAARRRLAFDELFLIQCGLMLIKKQNKDERLGISCEKNSALVKKVLESFPFELTDDQQKVFKVVSKDMESKFPMRRLIQGDVGSGKTAVAMLALVKAVENGYQGAFMAPTEILASQHYEKFLQQLEPFNIRVGLLSAKITKSKKLKEKIYKQIAEHELDIVIGTHALLQAGVEFAKLGLVITDEQHRFGVLQRSELEKKSFAVPDMLVMTATPIPRTMTLTVYGDLDVSLIKQMPPGRKPIDTYVRKISDRKKIYNFVLKEILAGRQAYVVCPLIERSESEKMQHLDPAEEMFDMLSNGVFKNIPCGLLHGKMKPKEKDLIMEQFRAGDIKLLVATTVVEVGVDVPNASVMVVENAERFGLAQLHQLRGRVGRGADKSYCILVSDSNNNTARARLSMMENTTDGFKLAEKDLELRGPGQFFGEAQNGLPDLKIADVFRDYNILIAARDAAEKYITDEKDLAHFANLRKNLAIVYGDRFSAVLNA